MLKFLNGFQSNTFYALVRTQDIEIILIRDVYVLQKNE